MCGGVYWFSQSMTRTTVSLFARSLHVSTGAFGFILAVYALLPMLLAIPVGGVAHRFGMVKLLRFGAAMMVMSSPLYGVSHSWWVLAIAQVFSGLGQLLVWLAAQALITQARDEEQKMRQISTFSLYMALGQLLGPLVGGLISDRLGYVDMFGAYGVASLILFLCSLCVGVDAHESSAFLTVLRQIPVAYVQAYQVLRSTNVIVVLLCTFVALFVIDFRSAYLPLYLHGLKFSNMRIGLLLSVGSLSGLCVKPIYSFLLRLAGFNRLLSWSLVIALGLFFVSPLLNSVWALGSLIFVTGLASGLNQPLTLSMISSQTTREDVGIGVGLRLMANRLSQLADPLFFSVVGTFMALRFSFWVVGGVLGLLALMAIVLLHRHDSAAGRLSRNSTPSVVS